MNAYPGEDAPLVKSAERPAHQWDRDAAHMAHPAARFTDLADRISWAVTGRALTWEWGDEDSGCSPHGEHMFDGRCAICKTPHAPWALRVVIDAVLDALVDDGEFRAVVIDPEEATRG